MSQDNFFKKRKKKQERGGLGRERDCFLMGERQESSVLSRISLKLAVLYCIHSQKTTRMEGPRTDWLPSLLYRPSRDSNCKPSGGPGDSISELGLETWRMILLTRDLDTSLLKHAPLLMPVASLWPFVQICPPGVPSHVVRCKMGT